MVQSLACGGQICARLHVPIRTAETQVNLFNCVTCKRDENTSTTCACAGASASAGAGRYGDRLDTCTIRMCVELFRMLHC